MKVVVEELEPPLRGRAACSYQNSVLATQLGNWALTHQRGRAFDSSVEYFLLSGPALEAEIQDARMD